MVSKFLGKIAGTFPTRLFPGSFLHEFTQISKTVVFHVAFKIFLAGHLKMTTFSTYPPSYLRFSARFSGRTFKNDHFFKVSPFISAILCSIFWLTYGTRDTYVRTGHEAFRRDPQNDPQTPLKLLIFEEFSHALLFCIGNGRGKNRSIRFPNYCFCCWWALLLF